VIVVPHPQPDAQPPEAHDEQPDPQLSHPHESPQTGAQTICGC